MSLDRIKSAIAAAIAPAAPGAQIVKYRAADYTADGAPFITITRNGQHRNRRTPRKQTVIHHMDIEVRTPADLSDGGTTEQEFDALTDAICDALDADTALGGACLLTDPPSVADDSGAMPGFRVLNGTVLMHYRRIRIQVSETATVNGG